MYLYKNNSERSDFIIASRAKRARSLRILSEHFAFPGNIDFAADDQGAF